jgi:hypothetical protein
VPSTTIRLSLFVGCLLATVACAPKPHAAYADVTPTSRTRFGDLARVVIADSAEGPHIVSAGHPDYPDAERAQGVQAAFAFAFVVDPTGRLEYETVSFIGGAAPGFFIEACNWLRDAWFAPIVRGGVPRRALVVSQITFGLERLDPAKSGQHPHTPNVEKIRRELVAKGLEASVRELEGRRHCP